MNALRSAGEATLSATFHVVEAVAVVLCAVLMAGVILVSFVVRECARAAEGRRSRTVTRTRSMPLVQGAVH